jgi:hypothetical protein
VEVVEEHSEGDLESVHSSANVVAELFREGIEFEDVSEEDGVLHESVDGRVKFGVFVVGGGTLDVEDVSGAASVGSDVVGEMEHFPSVYSVNLRSFGQYKA